MLFQRKDFMAAPDSGEDLPEKTGPARFWELLQDELAAVLVVNLLFLLTCLPVVTIPPALLALQTVARKIILGEPVSCARDYFGAFRKNFARSYGAFFLTALPMGLAGYGAAFYLRHAPEHPLLLAPFALCTTSFFVLMLSSTYFYGLLSDGMPLGQAVKSALFLGIAKPLRAVLAALCDYGTLLAAALFFPLSGIYLLLLGFSLPCVLGNFYIRTVLKQYRGGFAAQD